MAWRQTPTLRHRHYRRVIIRHVVPAGRSWLSSRPMTRSLVAGHRAAPAADLDRGDVDGSDGPGIDLGAVGHHHRLAALRGEDGIAAEPADQYADQPRQSLWRSPAPASAADVGAGRRWRAEQWPCQDRAEPFGGMVRLRRSRRSGPDSWMWYIRRLMGQRRRKQAPWDRHVAIAGRITASSRRRLTGRRAR